MRIIARDDVQPFVGNDKSIIRELASPENSGLTRHSFAEIRHRPGTDMLNFPEATFQGLRVDQERYQPFP